MDTPTPNPPISKWISMLYRYGQSYLSRKLQSLHIGSGQYVYLIYLYRSDGATQEEMAESLKIDKGTTARALKKLEEAGYVFRQPDSLDRRSNRVMLTKQAWEIRPLIQSAIEDWVQVITQGYTPAQVEEICKLLEHMALHAAAAVKELKTE